MKERAYEIVKNCNYDAYQRALSSMVYKFFDKKKGLEQQWHAKLE